MYRAPFSAPIGSTPLSFWRWHVYYQLSPQPPYNSRPPSIFFFHSSCSRAIYDDAPRIPPFHLATFDLHFATHGPLQVALHPPPPPPPPCPPCWPRTPKKKSPLPAPIFNPTHPARTTRPPVPHRTTTTTPPTCNQMMPTEMTDPITPNAAHPCLPLSLRPKSNPPAEKSTSGQVLPAPTINP